MCILKHLERKNETRVYLRHKIRKGIARKEVYLAVVITCLQRFESQNLKFLAVFLCSFSMVKFSFCDKTDFFGGGESLEKTLSKDQIQLGRNWEKSASGFIENSLLSLWTLKNFSLKTCDI